MNRRIAFALSFSVLLLVFPIFGNASGQTIAMAGVSVGNAFTYDNTYFWNSTIPGDAPSVSLIVQNQSTLQVTVQQVTGSTVELGVLWTYRNGTQQSSTELDEVNSGVTGTILVYAANLTAGNQLFPGATDLPYIINSTVIRTYANSFRETNHIQVNNTSIEGTLYSLIDLYFDKQTGILVEYYLTTVYSDLPYQTVTQHLLLKDSNVWAVASPSSSPLSTFTPSPTTNSPAPSTTNTPSGTSPGTSTGGLPQELPYVVVIVIITVAIVLGLFLFSRRRPKEQAHQDFQI